MRGVIFKDLLADGLPPARTHHRNLPPNSTTNCGPSVQTPLTMEGVSFKPQDMAGCLRNPPEIRLGGVLLSSSIKAERSGIAPLKQEGDDSHQKRRHEQVTLRVTQAQSLRGGGNVNNMTLGRHPHPDLAVSRVT